MTLRLTKVNFLKIIIFLPCSTEIRQYFSPKRPANLVFLAIFALNFSSNVFTTMQNIKKAFDNALFFTFFHNIGPNLAKMLPQYHTHSIITFMASNEICYSIQSILATLTGIQ